MLVKLDVQTWSARDKFKKMPRAEYEAVLTAYPWLRLPLEQEKLDSYYGAGEGVVLPLDEANDFIEKFPDMSCQYRGIKGMIKERVPGNSYINTYNIAVAGFGLLQINEVTYLEDACTDNLQSHLNDGWRILCVCPPNDQRRPTYILGRAENART